MNDRELSQLGNVIRQIQKCVCALKGVLEGNNIILQGLATEATLEEINNTVATEATLQSVLIALQSGREFEQNLVVDSTDTTYLQIRIFNTDSGTFDAPIYYDALGTLVVPTPPLTLVNPQFVLANILVQLQGLVTISNSIYSDTTSILNNTGNIRDSTASIDTLTQAINNNIAFLLDFFYNLAKGDGLSTVDTLRVALSETSMGELVGIRFALDTTITNVLATIESYIIPLSDFVTALDLNVGSTTANTLRVILANDSPLITNTDELLKGTTGAITSVTAVVALNSGNQSLIAADTTRRGLTIFNNTDRSIYVAFGTTANTTTSFSVKILAGGLYEVIREFAGLAINYSISEPIVTSGTVLVTALT